MSLKYQNCILAICFFAIAQLSFSANVTEYQYVDGNNNVYIIRPNSLDYQPITPEKSSSGEYSGGEPQTVVLLEAQYQKIEDIIKAIIKDKKNHPKNRQMGFGILSFSGKSIFINNASQLKTDLENELKLCLK